MDKENKVLEKIFNDLYEEYKKARFPEQKLAITRGMLKTYAVMEKDLATFPIQI